ncbi:hypothetical protein [Rhizobium sp. G21]|uniref:hypothetical protein n=1 Tax=Rhizobium sp. G21 TaxID=2758439 RepID=UPI001602DD74|nr:hypothetical protein [Rhizobium sp. G21]MBB1249810.1 hypothetical protein [Rhizobium sp. G21]
MREMAEKLLIIGTSNSIVNGGWSDGLASQTSCEIDKIVLGGAPFSQFLDVPNLIGEKKYKRIFVETSPNDESYPHSVGDMWSFHKLYFDFLQGLSTKAPLVVFRIPPLKYVSEESFVSKMQRKISSFLGALYIDSSDMLKSMNIRQSSAYRDPYHIETALAFALGSNLGKLSCEWDYLNRDDICSNYIYYKFLEEKYERISFENSLISEEFTVIPIGMDYKLPRPTRIFGFRMLSSRTSAIVRLNGVRQSRDIICQYIDQPNMGKVQFVPVPDGFLTKSLSVIKPWESFELGLHSNIFKPPFELAISGVMGHDDGS